MANEFVTRTGLIVSGSTYLPAATSASKGYILSFDTSTKEVYYMSTSSVTVTVPGSDTQVIYNNGGAFGAASGLVYSGSNVGIGTTSPAYKLEVNGAQRVADNFYLYNTVTNVASNFTNQRGLGFDASTGATEIAASTVPLQLSRFSTTGDVLTIRHSGSAVSSLKTDGGALFTGNVGIGITNPSARLHISESSGNAINVSRTGGYASLYGSSDLVFETDSVFYFGVYTPRLFSVNGNFYVSAGGLTSIGKSSANATLDVSGSVLISGSLTVSGSSTFTNIGPAVFTGSITQNASTASFGGLVGIGTTSPATKLHVVGYTTIDSVDVIAAFSSNNANKRVNIGYSTSGDYGFINAVDTGTAWKNLIFGINGGNIGIGTTSPSYKLHTVVASAADADIFQAGMTGVSNGFSVQRVSSSFVYSMLDGALGIGTSSPAYKLEVYGGASGTRTDIVARNAASTINIGVLSDNNGFVSSTSNLTFYAGASEYMRITSTGNVGIGTTSPNAKLDVSGSAIISGSLTTTGAISSAGNISTTSNGLIIASRKFSARDGNGVLLTADDGTSGLSIADSGNATFTGTVTATSFTGSFSGSVSAPGSTTQIVYNSGGALAADSGFVYSGSNVGIGTASPSQKLSVVGNVSVTSGDYRIYNGSTILSSTSTSLLEINAGGFSNVSITNGNVGIGTTSPSEKLHVIGNTIIQATSTGNGTTAIRVNNSAGTQVLAIGAAGEIIMNNSSKISTVVDPTSTQPQLELYNSGTGYTTLQSSTSYGLLLNPNGGNVGIGTTTPSSSLHVVGTITAATTADSGRINLGTQDTNQIGLYRDNTYDLVLLQDASSGNPLYLAGAGDVRVSIDSNNNQTSSKFIVGNNDVKSSNELFSVDESGSGYFSGSLTVQGTITAQKLNVQQITSSVVYSSGSNIFGNDISNTQTFTGSVLITGSEILNGKLYLGTNSPSTSNSLQLSYNTTSGDSIVSSYSSGGNTTLALQTSDAGSPTTRLYINSSGNVGIGTTSPALKLDVIGSARIGQNSNSSTNTVLELTSGGSGYNALIDFGYYNSFDASIWRLGIFGDDGSKFKLQDTGGGPAYDRFVVGSNFAFLTGSVGIGTASPSNKLDVTVDLDGAQRVAIFKNTYSTGYTSVAIDRPNTARYSFLEHTTTGTTDWYVGTAYNGGGANSAYQIGTGINTSDSKLFITTAGNVGIGTTNPSSLLNVSSATQNATALVVQDNARKVKIGRDQIEVTDLSDNASTMYLQPNSNLVINGTAGSVGIGTQPSYKLHVDGNTDSLIKVSNGNDTYIKSTYYGYSATYNVIQIGDVYGKGNNGVSIALGIDPSIISGGSFSGYEIALPNLTEFITANGPSGSATDWNQNVLVITGSNIGIGTSTPSNTLQVNGGVTATSFTGSFSGSVAAPGSTTQIVYNSGGALAADSGLVYSGSRVGIGTSTPSGSLDIYRAYSSATAPLYIRNGAESLNTQVYDTAVIQQSDVTTLRLVERNTADVDQVMTFMIGDNYGKISTSKQPLQFYVSGSASGIGYQGLSGNLVMHMALNGNVGIGTNNPNYKLEVSGSTNVYDRLDVGTGVDFPAGTSNAIATFKQAGSVGGIILQEAGGTSNDRILKLNSNGDEQSIEATYRDTGPYGNLVFKTGGSNRMFISSSGNVGIGTTSPVSALHVVGDGDTVTLQKSNNVPALAFLGTSTNKSVIEGGDNFNFYTLGTSRIYISGSGNVGIGTTSPDSKLHVAGGQLTLKGGTATDQQIVFNFAREYVNGIYNSSGHFRLQDNSLGGTVYQWDGSSFCFPNGNVGIGTTTPGNKLEVNGGLTATSLAYNYTTFNGQAGGSAGWIDFGRLSLPQNGYNASISFYAGSGYNANNDQNAYATLFIRTSNGSSTDANGFYFSAFATRYGRNSSFLSDIRIKPTGSNEYQIYGYTGQYSGVGYYKVEGAGTTFTSVNTASSDPGSGSTAYVVPFEYRVQDTLNVTGSNVGIGTTSPSSKLEVYTATGDTKLTVTTTGGNSYVPRLSLDKRGDSAWNISSPSGGFNFAIDQDGSTRLWIASNTGNVGIGTTSPSYKLHVSGTIAIENQGTTTIESTTFSGSLTTNTNIASVPTASFKAAFFDYYVASGSVNMRAGTVMAVHNNSTSRYTDTSTGDIGTTAAVDFSTSIVAGSLVLTANISSGTWEVKTAYRAL